MKKITNRNYYVAYIMCIACTLMTLSSNSADIGFLIKSDLNVALWLFVAWLFDNARN